MRAALPAGLGSRRNLRNDLLLAADSITSTMSSLVKELHSGKLSICVSTKTLCVMPLWESD